MSYFVEHAQTGVNGAITTIAQNMPTHEANDILVAHIVVDSGTITVSGSSWAALPNAPTNPVTQGVISYLLYVKAAGSSETLTLTTGDAYTCGIYCYREVDGTTPFDGVTPLHAGVAGATTTPVNSSVTTGTSNAMVIFHIAQDGTTPQVLSDPGVMSLYNADSTGTTATTSAHHSVAWYMQRSTGATPVANWSSSVSAVYVRITFVLRNASGGRIPAYIDDVSSPGTRLTCGHHIAAQNNISYTASGSFVVTANINSKTLTQAAAANGADFGINPYSNAVNSTAAATARTALTGPELVLTSGRDLSTGLICGSFIAGTPKMGTFGIGTVAQGGVVVRVASGANNWNAYQVAAKDSVPNLGQRCVFSIQAGYAGSDYDTGSSGNASASTVTYIQFLRNAPSFSSTVYMSELHQVQKQVVAGGDNNYPVDADGMDEIGKSFRLPVIQKVGSAGLLSFVPIQIGGGDAVNFQIGAGSLQFPRRADTTKREMQYHAADNTLGISYYGVSGDVIKHTNSLVSSPTPFYWEIHSSATSAATWDFTGMSIIGANVTLRNVMTFDSMSFTSCPTLTFSSCTVTNSTITKVPATNDSLTTNSTTVIQNCSINTILVTAGNRWASVPFGDLDIFSGNTFTGSHTSGHAIRISSAGPNTMSGNTFTNYGPTVFGFHTTNDITEGTDDWITKADHGYTTGDPIRYMKQGGTAVTGLTDDTTYYVRAVSSSTIAFYTSSANAIADTSRISLSKAGAETHYINSLGAAIFNDSAGTVTLTITGTTSVPTIRNATNSTTNVILAVAVALRVVNESGTAVQGAQVYFQKSAVGKTWNYTSDTGNNAGDVDFVVNEVLDTDLPQTGWIHVWDASTNLKQNYRYSSWTSKTFTFPSEVTGSATSAGTSTTLNSTGIGALNIQEGDTIRNTTDGSWAIVDELSTDSATTTALTGGSDNTWQNSDAFSVHKLAVTYADNDDLVDIPIFNGQTNASGDISTTYNYSAYSTNLAVTIRVRSNTGATKYIPLTTSGTITSSGYSGTLVLTQDTVAT